MLCLHVLKDRFDVAKCGQSFIESGGFRLLKKYIKHADDDDSIYELITIVKICKVLPFDAEIVKNSEIGKVINKLLKFKFKTINNCSNSNSTTDSSNITDNNDDILKLQNEIKELKDLWKSSVEAMSRSKEGNHSPRDGYGAAGSNSVKMELNAECMDLLEAINERMYTDRKQQTIIKHQSASYGQEPALYEVINIDSNGNDSGTVEAKSATPAVVNKAAGGGTSLLQILTQQQQQSTPASQGDSGSSSAGNVRDKKGMEMMADKAKKLLAAKDLAEKMRSNVNIMDVDGHMESAADDGVSAGSGSGSTHSVYLEVDPHDPEAYANNVYTADGQTVKLFSLREINKPVGAYKGIKSCLKKSLLSSQSTESMIVPVQVAITGSNAEAAASVGIDKQPTVKTKKPLKWADADGGILREVRLFEVKKLRAGATVNYKTHRDMVRKERQLEQKTNTSKIVEAMQPTIVWYKPKKRVLSFEMQEYAAGPVDSPEAEIQARRIAVVLESRYMDDVSIPADPDEISGIRLNGSSSATSAVCEDVPWLLLSTQQGEMDNSDTLQELEALSAQVNGYSYSANMSMVDADGYVGATYNSGAYHTPLFSQEMINSLPDCLRGLEPELLAALVQDESNILEILNDDGTVNEFKVAQLRVKLNLPTGHNFLSTDNYMRMSYNGNTNASDRYDSSRYIPAAAAAQQYDQQFEGGFTQAVGSGGMMRNSYDISHQTAEAGSVGGTTRVSRWSAPTAAGGEQSHATAPQQQQQQSSAFFSMLEQNLGPPGMMAGRSITPIGTNYNQANLQRQRVGAGGGRMKRDLDSSAVGRGGSSIGSSSSQGGIGDAKRAKKFPANKGTVACKFYGTPKGCQFGDKCSFIHATAADAAGSARGHSGAAAGAPQRMAGMAGRVGNNSINAALGIGTSIEAGVHNQSQQGRQQQQQSRFSAAVAGDSVSGAVDDFEDEEETSSRDPFGRDSR